MTKQIRTVDVDISEWTTEGIGRGFWLSPDGRSWAVDVPFTAPGDKVTVNLLKRKKGVYASKAVEWLTLSNQRIAPQCRHFGKCGGCKWQHISYAEQLKQKEKWLADLLKPYLDRSVTWHSIIPCDPPWNYRNKMELTFSSDRAGNRYLGLILQGTKGHVFQMQECHLMQAWMMDANHTVVNWWEASALEAYRSIANTGALRTLTLREGIRSGDRMVMLTVSGNPSYALNQKQIQNFIDALKKAITPSKEGAKLSLFLRIQQIAKGKPTQFFEMLLDGPDHIREMMTIETAGKKSHALQFQISPSAFFQPNTVQAERLYSRALQLTDLSPNSLVYDLYCGTGTLGLCLAKQVREVIGIELSPESSLDARENAKANQLENISILTGDVGHLLPTLLEEKRRPDAVLVDPPRVGLDMKALKNVIEAKAPVLTYISCNPATQVANLDLLIQGGYRLKAVQPVDQFPQTSHVENILVLTTLA